MAALTITLLADHPEVISTLAGWFAAEWGGPDLGAAAARYRRSLPERANRDRLPLCLLGFCGDELVATATLKFRELDYSPDAEFWLGSVYVRADARRRGHGTAIVAAAETLAATRRFTPLYLYTPTREAFYLRRGWRTVGRTLADGKPAVIMQAAGAGQ